MSPVVGGASSCLFKSLAQEVVDVVVATAVVAALAVVVCCCCCWWYSGVGVGGLNSDCVGSDSAGGGGVEGGTAVLL